MARITVEDSLQNVSNLFELVLVAAKRARRIANGAEPLVDRENDKPTVIALREIAEGLVTRDLLAEADSQFMGRDDSRTYGFRHWTCLNENALRDRIRK